MTQPTISMKVEGLAELHAALKALPVALQAGPLRRAVRDGAVVVQKAAQVRAPVAEAAYVKQNKTIQPGTTRRAIYIARSRENSSRVQEAYIVGIRYGKRYRKRGLDAWYWRFLEFGTSKMVARPFMRPAFQATRAEQVEAMRLRLATDIERIAKKIQRDWDRSMGRKGRRVR